MGEEFKKTEPGMSVALEDILDRELGRTLAGKARIDECCAPHPEIAGDLKPLLELALASREALRVEVTAETRAAAREKLMARAGSILQAPGLGARRLILRPLALAAGLLVILSAGTAFAASSAAPDNILYPLKQRLEDARVSLAVQKLDQAQVEVSHANARLDELEKSWVRTSPSS